MQFHFAEALSFRDYPPYRGQNLHIVDVIPGYQAIRWLTAHDPINTFDGFHKMRIQSLAPVISAGPGGDYFECKTMLKSK